MEGKNANQNQEDITVSDSPSIENPSPQDMDNSKISIINNASQNLSPQKSNNTDVIVDLVN